MPVVALDVNVFPADEIVGVIGVGFTVTDVVLVFEHPKLVPVIV